MFSRCSPGGEQIREHQRNEELLRSDSDEDSLGSDQANHLSLQLI